LAVATPRSPACRGECHGSHPVSFVHRAIECIAVWRRDRFGGCGDSGGGGGGTGARSVTPRSDPAARRPAAVVAASGGTTVTPTPGHQMSRSRAASAGIGRGRDHDHGRGRRCSDRHRVVSTAARFGHGRHRHERYRRPRGREHAPLRRLRRYDRHHSDLRLDDQTGALAR